jgi:hypothetical protein
LDRVNVSKNENPLAATLLLVVRGIVRVLFFMLLACAAAEARALNVPRKAGETGGRK